MDSLSISMNFRWKKEMVVERHKRSERKKRRKTGDKTLECSQSHEWRNIHTKDDWRNPFGIRRATILISSTELYNQNIVDFCSINNGNLHRIG